MDTMVTLKRGSQRVDIEPDSVNTAILRRSFKVNPTEVWLKGECDHKPFFPDDSGSFADALSDLFFGAVLSVEGPEINTQAMAVPITPNQHSMTISSTAQSSGGGSSSMYKSNPVPVFKSVIPKSTKAAHSLKVVKAKLEWLKTGKPDFSSESQIFIDINEETATVEHIAQAVKDRWGPNYSLVTIDGLKLEDSEGTKGMKFWKSPRRRLFAVQHSALKGKGKNKGKKRCIDVLSSDSEVELPKVKKQQFFRLETSIEDVTDDVYRVERKVDSLKDEIDSVKSSLDEILKLDEKSTIPIGLQKYVRDAFQCKICLRAPIDPPVIVSKCCNSILGCEVCVNTWYKGESVLTKACPSCNTVRGLSQTMVLKGLDSLLKECRKVMLAKENEDSD